MTPRGRLVRAALRALLWLYPPAFRRMVGLDAVDTHLDRYREARQRGRLAAVRAAAVAIADLAWGAVPEWAASLGDLRPVSLRLVLRALTRRPVQSAVIVGTLSLAIGANTAIFSLIDAVLLRPLAVDRPDSLVAVYRVRDPAAGSALEPASGGVPFPAFRDLRREMRALDDLAAYADNDVSLEIDGRGSVAQLAIVSGTYFPLLGVQPVLGRLIEPRDDEAPFASAVVVLSDALWASAFGRDPRVLGTQIRLGPTDFTVVGVAPPGFRGTHLARTPDVWVPLMMTRALGLGGMLSGRFSQTLFTTFRGLGWLQLVGRLPDGGSADEAARDLTRVLRATDPAIDPSEPESDLPRMTAVPVTTGAALTERASLVTFIGLLTALVVLVLLLACVNVAHLLLLRGSQRARELGVRAALGASRRRLAGMLLAESLTLAVAAGALGIALGLAMIHGLTQFRLPGDVTIAALDLSLDPRLLAFALALSLATVLLFGLAPAWRASRVDPVRAFRSGVRGVEGRRTPVGLIGAQVAISVVILVAAGLFTRSLRAGLQADPGFEPDGVAAVTIELRLHGFADAQAGVFYEAVLDRLAAAPGIDAAALASHVPPAPALALPLQAVGGLVDEQVQVMRSFVSAGYFEALRIPVIAGREFDRDDRPGSPLVAIVNESAARALWPDGQAVGRRVLDFGERSMTIVGVVRDAVVETLHDTGTPMFYYAIGQERVSGKVSVLARSADVAGALAAVRGVIGEVDRRVAVIDARALSDRIAALLMPQRFGSALLGLFGFLGMTIAAIGIFATVASAVERRRAEIGLRLALGAAPGAVVRLVLGGTGLAAALGLGVGFAVAAVAGRGMERFLIGIGPLDVAAYLGAAALLAAMIGAAAWFPLRHLARVDPASVMRLD